MRSSWTRMLALWSLPCAVTVHDLPGQSRTADRCEVRDVIAGETLRCRDGRRLRLLLVDAPESDQQPLGSRAAAALLALAPPGTMLALEYDVDRTDGYGATLAYAYLPDGRMLNEEIARAGFASVSIFPPNVKHADRVRAAARAARAARRGVWSAALEACPAIDRRRGLC
jgi:micrococcal nuclease